MKTSTISSELNSKMLFGDKYSVRYGQKMTIDEGENNNHYQLLLIRGSTGAGYGAFLLTGYGIGGDSRYKVIKLDDSNSVDVTISGTTYVVTPTVNTQMYIQIIYLMENKHPSVSIS